MKRYQCFMCGYIEEREDGVVDERKTKDDNGRNDIPPKVDEALGKENLEARKCPKCGEAKWIELQTEQTGTGANYLKSLSDSLLNVWNIITDFISTIIVYIIVFWRATIQHRQNITNKLIAFIGCLSGIYLIDALFHCGFDRSAILMALLYILFKLKMGE